MKKTNILYTHLLALVAFAMLPSTPISAQNNTATPRLVSANPAHMYQQGDSLYINMDVHYGGIHLERDRELTLTPVLHSSTDSLYLTPFLINGKIRQKAYKRSLALNKLQEASASEYASVTEYKKGDFNPIRYTKALPFEPWMRNASLSLYEDFCGCGKHVDENYSNLVIDKVILERIPEPLLAYIQPAGQEIKARKKQLDLYLNFPVSKTEIRPGYMNNESELQKIRNLFKELQDDPNVNVTHINIEGYASPEGSVAFNQKLSEGRADALRGLLTLEKYYPDSIYTVEYGGENWDGLVTALENSSLEYRNKVLSIIHNTPDAEQRKNAVKKLEGGAPYRQMLKEIYPKLRKVVCHVDFSVRKFTTEEGKEILKTNPSYLSLEEMYRIAYSYPEGTDDFIRVFGIAADEYPNDPTANLNLAAAALKRNDPQRAILNLNKADKSTPEYLNNMAVYYMQVNKPEEAKELLTKAIQNGFEMSRQNLEILKMKYPKLNIR